MKITEIRSKLQHYKELYKGTDGYCEIEDFSDDLEYLLTKLEQAERAFEKILGEEGRKIWKDKDLAPIYREISIIALQQIRS